MCENTDTQTETEREREMFHAVRDDVHDVHDDVRYKKGGVVFIDVHHNKVTNNTRKKRGLKKPPFL